MALKDNWVDKINGVDINSADDINQVAHAVIELEETAGFYDTEIIEVNKSGNIVTVEHHKGKVCTCSANASEIPQDTEEITFYTSNKNLCDGVIANIAPASGSGADNGSIIAGSNLVSIICPIKGGEFYAISRKSAASSNRFRFSCTSEYPAEGVPLCDAIFAGDAEVKYGLPTSVEAKYLVIYLSNESEDVSNEQYQVELGTTVTQYVPHVGTSRTVRRDALTANLKLPSDVSYIWCDCAPVTVSRVVGLLSNEEVNESFVSSDSVLGNVSIVCAKEHTFTDGTPPKIEYFLLEEPLTNKFYFSKDLKEKHYAFTFEGNSAYYSFGILQNGDIIAVRYASSLGDENHDDNVRVNPYVFLASENWEKQHEVDFGTSIKPCGWLSNCGFRVLPDGTTLFCEYTRPTVATSNVWRLTGNPTEAKNWVIVKTFTLSGNSETGFKHCHTVQHDHFTNIAYFATGDDSTVASVYASADSGLTWTQIREPSEKYCRLLNFTFTKEYIYWASDSHGSVFHWVFRAKRDTDGVLDYSTVEDFLHLNYENTGVATYGTAYLPSLNAMLLLDRSDGPTTELTVRAVGLTEGTLHDVITLDSAGGNAKCIGFRTRFSEWYPKNDTVHIGFMFVAIGPGNLDDATNGLACFGNEGHANTGEGSLNINNLSIRVFRNHNSFGAEIDTKCV